MSQGRAGAQLTTITKTAIIVGRNNTPVPPDEVELMAQIGCTDREIAEHFGVTDTTLRRNFVDFLIKGRSQLKQKLRQAQLRVAFEGNPTMLIWLGKNILLQSDLGLATDTRQILPFTDDDDVAIEDEEAQEQLVNLESNDFKQ